MTATRDELLAAWDAGYDKGAGSPHGRNRDREAFLALLGDRAAALDPAPNTLRIAYAADVKGRVVAFGMTESSEEHMMGMATSKSNWLFTPGYDGTGWIEVEIPRPVQVVVRGEVVGG